MMTFVNTYKNIRRTVVLPVTQQELDNWQKNRMSAGAAMPRLSQAQLDFLVYGVADDSLFDTIEVIEDV
jgi:hypothetical protein